MGERTRSAGRMRATAQLTMLVIAFVMATGCGGSDRATPTDSATGAGAAGASSGIATGDGRPEVGALAPAYAAQTLDGDSVSLAAERGQVLLLNVWATWCIPCRQEMPQLEALHERYRERGLRLVGVSIDGDGAGDAIRRFVAAYKVTFPIWHDAEDRVTTVFRTVGVPTTFLIDRQGVLRWRAVGALEPGDTTLTAAIEKALGS